jgi:mannosyltransferase OCH1-like enzyme
MKTWADKLLDYDMISWNLKKFNINNSLWVKQAYEAKKYAFAADYIKFYSIFNYGGIYLDSDIEVLKPFDNLLNTNVLLAYENNKTKEIEGGVFGAEKYSSFIKRCLDYYEDRQFIKPDGTYDTRILPQIMREIAENSSEHITIYPSEYFTANNWKTGIIKKTGNTYSIHHFAGSWLSCESQKENNFKKAIYKVLGDTVIANIFFFVYDIFNGIFSKFNYVKNRIRNTGFKNALKYYYKKYIR